MEVAKSYIDREVTAKHDVPMLVRTATSRAHPDSLAHWGFNSPGDLRRVNAKAAGFLLSLRREVRVEDNVYIAGEIGPPSTAMIPPARRIRRRRRPTIGPDRATGRNRDRPSESGDFANVEELLACPVLWRRRHCLIACRRPSLRAGQCLMERRWPRPWGDGHHKGPAGLP
jgi:hypothetical protein